MKIVIAGGTGLIGRHLTGHLIKQGHEVMILSRSPKKTGNSSLHYVRWLNEGDQPDKELEGAEAFVNLAGTTINSRWTSKGKEAIVQSRLKAVSEIHRIISKLALKPAVLINASAIGYYGTSEEETFTENAGTPGVDFLADTVIQWEEAAAKTEQLGVRIVLCRFGVVLDQAEGALPKMVTPYNMFAGGTIGTGRQWLSWIHIEDVSRALGFVLEQEAISGPVNFTAPHPVQMKTFGKELASVLNKPHWLPVPGFALKMLLGEMSLLVLEGQRVLPEKLLAHGFEFNYPTLHGALTEIFKK
ncbi:multidrug MFS transporter [Mesobacillus campisalis]|uniref:Multidrug MFS transporter n=1 Tax=Mesobacillus campisalis TaxID=1408103 RepID=A0A0M2SU82_9BACI|nr:TIGR01777 family oxidoreductase [Mesobacillus campisalis]KKK36547.1 multidrug MFS transporter [Mesobacillus campisalis]